MDLPAGEDSLQEFLETDFDTFTDAMVNALSVAKQSIDLMLAVE